MAHLHWSRVRDLDLGFVLGERRRRLHEHVPRKRSGSERRRVNPLSHKRLVLPLGLPRLGPRSQYILRKDCVGEDITRKRSHAYFSDLIHFLSYKYIGYLISVYHLINFQKNN